MYYSYYFDVEKKHRINLGFKALVTNEEADGTINAQFHVYIQEVLGKEVKREESKNVQFRFDGKLRDDEDSSDYDVDFLRERIASSEKFIFKVLNNRDATQNAVIGLITPTAAKNPLGCEIIYEDEPYTAELKAGNLSKLESNYNEPLIRQTVVLYNFNEGGMPEEIRTPDGAEYVNAYRLYRLSRLSTVFKEEIKGTNKFVLEMNIAPETFDVAVEPTIFDVVLHGIGTFSLNKTTAHFMPDGGTSGDRVSVPLVKPLTPEFFFNSGLRSQSLLTVTGDGKGNVKATFADIAINATYNKENIFKGISIEGKIRKDSTSRVKSKVDNIVAYYEK